MTDTTGLEEAIASSSEDRDSALPKSAQEAIAAARERIDRAVVAADLEGIIGGSKDLVETAAKVVLDVLGQS